jgi:hypothetical protein
MNRNSTAILATAIFFSMLASSGVRSTPSPRSGTNTAPLQLPASSSTKAAHTDCEESDCKNPKQEGEKAFADELTGLFKGYCQDGNGARPCDLKPENFVIALVPDPVHTHLALYFDRTIDTIEESLQDDGYVFYKAIVPWDHEAHPQPDDYKLRLAATLYQEGREQLPGIMLFSASVDADADTPKDDAPKDDALKDPLAVMLVAESPTGGVNKEQFQSAIKQIKSLTNTESPSDIRLRILGPTFSGSLSSLKSLLTCGKDPEKKDLPCFSSATILSGTVTGRKAVEDFGLAVTNFQHHETGPLKTTFDTLQETDAVMLQRFIEFIAGRSYGDRNYDVRHIAELSEDETAYGSFHKWANQSQSEYPRESGYCNPYPTEPKNTIPPQNSAQSCSILKLYFPREISQLRAAYQDSSASTNGAERLPFQNLPHNFGITGVDDDTVTSFSQKQTPLSQEAILLSIVAELRKHSIQFVVLNATDPLDTLFLSHYLRSAYPQGRIVTMGVDMLFPREVEDTTLHGILALSTYSIAPLANHQFYQLWQSGAERTFPSAFDIGTYNALHSLMTAEAVPAPGPPAPCDAGLTNGDCEHQLRNLFALISSGHSPAPCDPSLTENDCIAQLRSQVAGVSPAPGRPFCDPTVTKNDCTDRLRSLVKEKKSSNREIPLYLIQYGWRERGDGRFTNYNAPPVRLSALGHDGYWPVANLGPFDLGPDETKMPTIPTLLPQVMSNPPKKEIVLQLPGLCNRLKYPCPVEQFSSAPAPLEVPDSWIVFEVFGLALAAGFCISVWFASVRSPWQQLAQFAPTLPILRCRLIASAGLLLLYALLLMLWPFFHGHRDWVITSALRHQVILVAAIFIVFTVTLLDISQRSGLRADRKKRGRLVWADLQKHPVVLVFVGASIFITGFIFFRPEHLEEHLAGLRHFAVLRAIQLTSGLSPVLPILFLVGACLWWANHIVAGWILLDDRRPRLPAGKTRCRIAEDDDIARDLQTALRPGRSSITHYLILASIALGALLLTGFTFIPIRTIESSRFDRSQLLPFLVIASAGLIGTTLRLWTIWFRTRRLLVALDSTPLRRGFQRLEGFTWKPLWKFGGVNALSEYQRLRARQTEALQTAVNVPQELQGSNPLMVPTMDETNSAVETAKEHHYPPPFEELSGSRRDRMREYIRALFSGTRWNSSRNDERKVIETFGEHQRKVSLEAGKVLASLSKVWEKEGEEPKRKREQEKDEELKTRAYERFVSLVYVSFLLVVLARMRTLIMAISGMYILILLALTLYPFEPRPAIQIYLIVMLVFIVSVVGLVFAQIHRDATLSHITDTKPGELGGDFYLRMASFVALPLFTFFASQFPEIGRTFYSWLEPALQALNR